MSSLFASLLFRWKHDTSVLLAFGWSLHFRKYFPNFSRSAVKISSASSNEPHLIVSPQSSAYPCFVYIEISTTMYTDQSDQQCIRLFVRISCLWRYYHIKLSEGYFILSIWFCFSCLSLLDNILIMKINVPFLGQSVSICLVSICY